MTTVEPRVAVNSAQSGVPDLHLPAVLVGTSVILPEKSTAHCMRTCCQEGDDLTQSTALAGCPRDAAHASRTAQRDRNVTVLKIHVINVWVTAHIP